MSSSDPRCPRCCSVVIPRPRVEDSRTRKRPPPKGAGAFSSRVSGRSNRHPRRAWARRESRRRPAAERGSSRAPRRRRPRPRGGCGRRRSERSGGDGALGGRLVVAVPVDRLDRDVGAAGQRGRGGERQDRDDADGAGAEDGGADDDPRLADVDLHDGGVRVVEHLLHRVDPVQDDRESAGDGGQGCDDEHPERDAGHQAGTSLHGEYSLSFRQGVVGRRVPKRGTTGRWARKCHDQR